MTPVWAAKLARLCEKLVRIDLITESAEVGELLKEIESCLKLRAERRVRIDRLRGKVTRGEEG